MSVQTRGGLAPLGKDEAPKAPLLLGGEDEDAAWRDVHGGSGADMTSRIPTYTGFKKRKSTMAKTNRMASAATITMTILERPLTGASGTPASR